MSILTNAFLSLKKCICQFGQILFATLLSSLLISRRITTNLDLLAFFFFYLFSAISIDWIFTFFICFASFYLHICRTLLKKCIFDIATQPVQLNITTSEVQIAVLIWSEMLTNIVKSLSSVVLLIRWAGKVCFFESGECFALGARSTEDQIIQNFLID